MKISKDRMWLAGGVVLCLLVLVGGWFALIAPKRADAASTRDQLASQRSTNDQTRAKIAQLKAQFATLPAKRAELAKIREAMPAYVAESSLQRQLDTLAKGSGTTVLSVTDGDQTAFSPSAGATASASASASSSDTSSASSAPTANGATSGVTTMPVTITAMSTFAGSQAFLQKLQDKMPRAFLVTALDLQSQPDAAASAPKPATSNGDVQITITGNVFVLNTDAPGSGSTGGSTATASSTAN